MNELYFRAVAFRLCRAHEGAAPCANIGKCPLCLSSGQRPYPDVRITPEGCRERYRVCTANARPSLCAALVVLIASLIAAVYAIAPINRQPVKF